MSGGTGGSAQGGLLASSGGAVAAGGSPGVAGTTVGVAGASARWTLPHSGGPTWRDSNAPLCGRTELAGELRLWSDPRGVYALASMDIGRQVLFNDGHGWIPTPMKPGYADHISGVPNGTVILYGSSNCGIEFFADDSQSCVGPVGLVSALFAVDEQRVFVVSQDRILHFNGSYFTQYAVVPGATPYNRSAIWANQDTIVVAVAQEGSNALHVYEGDSRIPRPIMLPEATVPTSLWGFGREDLWIGTADGNIAYFDGNEWTLTRVGTGHCAEVGRLWGAEGVLYFATSTEVGKWSDGELEPVLSVPCSERVDNMYGDYEEVTIQGLWGNAPDEVFISLREWRALVQETNVGTQLVTLSPDSCGDQRVYWYDGKNLGPL